MQGEGFHPQRHSNERTNERQHFATQFPPFPVPCATQQPNANANTNTNNTNKNNGNNGNGMMQRPHVCGAVGGGLSGQANPGGFVPVPVNPMMMMYQPPNPQQQQRQQQKQKQKQQKQQQQQVVKVRKPYTITKQRERWTEEEHQRFVDALKMHGRAWRKIEEYVGTKTAVQIRSHAQKFFAKLQKDQRNMEEADQLSDVTRWRNNNANEGGGYTETSMGSIMTTTMNETTTVNMNNSNTAGEKQQQEQQSNKDPKLLKMAFLGNKKSSQVVTSKKEEEVDLLSNLSRGGGGGGTKHATNSAGTGGTCSSSGKTTASDIPPARPKRKPAHPYPRKQPSYLDQQKRRGKNRSINEALIDVASVEQQSSASATHALMNATSEMLRNRMIHMQMQQLIAQQSANGAGTVGGGGVLPPQNQQNPLLAYLALNPMTSPRMVPQDAAQNSLAQLQALMTPNPMYAANVGGGFYTGVPPNMAFPTLKMNPAFDVKHQQQPISLDNANNKNNSANESAKMSAARGGAPIAATIKNDNNNDNNNLVYEVSKQTPVVTVSTGTNSGGKSIGGGPNSQSAFSGYVRPLPSTNQFRQLESGNNNNNTSDASMMAAFQQQQMQYWNSQMAAMAAVQDPNAYTQFLQHQTMGNMTMMANQQQQQQEVAPASTQPQSALATMTEAMVQTETNAENEGSANEADANNTKMMQVELTAGDKEIAAAARAQHERPPQLPKETEAVIANNKNDGRKQEDENKNSPTTGRRSRRAAAVVTAEKVTKQVSGRTKRRNSTNVVSYDGSGCASRENTVNPQNPDGKNPGSSGSDGSDDVAQKGFESTSFRIAQPGEI